MPTGAAVAAAMDGGGAYGAGKATGKFDIISFVKKPQVILRAVSLVSVSRVLLPAAQQIDR